MTCPGCGKDNIAYSSKSLYEKKKSKKKKKYYRCQKCSTNYKTIFECQETLVDDLK